MGSALLVRKDKDSRTKLADQRRALWRTLSALGFRHTYTQTERLDVADVIGNEGWAEWSTKDLSVFGQELCDRVSPAGLKRQGYIQHRWADVPRWSATSKATDTRQYSSDWPASTANSFAH